MVVWTTVFWRFGHLWMNQLISDVNSTQKCLKCAIAVLWVQSALIPTKKVIKTELLGRFCSNFDMSSALMKGSGILNFKIFAATLAAKNGDNSHICI